jgi:Arc/MetJ family transcription regulator
MIEVDMRTTINVEDDIFEELMRFTDARTKTEAVNRAIAEWVRHKRLLLFRARRGKIAWEGKLEEMRALEVAESRETHG